MEVIKTSEKNCGNCRWFNYRGKRGEPVAECETYSSMHYSTDKKCSSWKLDTRKEEAERDK